MAARDVSATASDRVSLRSMRKPATKEVIMANTAVDVKKVVPTRAAAPDAWQSFRGDMDRLFDRFTGGFGLPSFPRLYDVEPSTAYSVPAIDVAETDKAFTVTAELPGMDEKDIDVSVTGDILVLKGEKQEEKEEKNKNYYLSERSYGQFQRSFSLPGGIDRDKIAADFSKGVLKITLPKSVEAQKQQKKIEVKAT
jgi:HSP20 family protein